MGDHSSQAGPTPAVAPPAAPAVTEVKVDLNAKGLPPASIPEFDPITPAQEQLMKDFIAHHRPNAANDPAQRRYASMFDDNWDTMAKKFLISRKWNVADAGKMYSETIDFRKKMRFHETPIWPPAFAVRGYDFGDVQRVLGEDLIRTDAYQREEPSVSEKGSASPNTPSSSTSSQPPPFKNQLDRIHSAVGNYHPKVIHYWDKTGHPVFIEKIPGRYKEYLTAFKGALAPPKTIAEAWEEFHWHQAEVTSIITRYQNRTRGAEFGREITSVTVVMDCADLGYGILLSEAARLSDKLWSQESKVVPEGLHRIFLVNCPSVINIAFGLLKHVVPKRTQEKIVFCGKDRTPAVLRAVIDEDKLPRELGGTCECPGGCLSAQL